MTKVFSANQQRGFTVLELLTVVATIGILGAVAVIGYQGYTARARGAEIIEKYDAIRTSVGIRAKQGPSEDCAELAKGFDTTNLNASSAALAYGFESAGAGFRPVLTVCAQAGNGQVGVNSARGTYETLVKQGLVEPNPVVTDSAVSFSLRLTDGDEPLCNKRPATAANPSCGSATAQPAQPAQAAQTPTVPTAASAVQTASGGATAAPRCVVTPGQKVQRQVMVFGSGLTGYVMNDGTLLPPPEHVVPESTVTEPGCTNAYGGDCATDFPGVCDVSYVQEVCRQTCGVCSGSEDDVVRIIPASVDRSIRQFSTEVSIVGGQQVAASGVHGATILSYAGDAQHTNEFAIWNPASLTITFQDQEINTGANVNDGRDHRITTTWSSDTGALVVYDNGKQVFQTTVAKGGELRGPGKLVLGQDQDSFGGGFGKEDAYTGQIVSAAVAYAAPTAAVIAAGPLQTALTAATGLATHVMIGPDGRPMDTTGRQKYTTGGSMTAVGMQVDTALFVTADCK